MSAAIRDHIARILAPALEAGEHSKIRQHLSTVAENVYQLLPSGDYGRGDVQDAILELIAT